MDKMVKFVPYDIGLIVGEITEAATKQRRRAMLQHLAGPHVQGIFTTLTETGNATDYNRAVDTLNAYFVPKVNTTYARQTFHQISQKPGEIVQQVSTRLQKSSECGLAPMLITSLEPDTVVNKSTSTYITANYLRKAKV